MRNGNTKHASTNMHTYFSYQQTHVPEHSEDRKMHHSQSGLRRARPRRRGQYLYLGNIYAYMPVCVFVCLYVYDYRRITTWHCVCLCEMYARIIIISP